VLLMKTLLTLSQVLIQIPSPEIELLIIIKLKIVQQQKTARFLIIPLSLPQI